MADYTAYTPLEPLPDASLVSTLRERAASYPVEPETLASVVQTIRVRNAVRAESSGGGSPPVLKSYYMRAWRTTTSTYINWVSLGAPDMTGASSGVPIIQLTDIITTRYEE